MCYNICHEMMFADSLPPAPSLCAHRRSDISLDDFAMSDLLKRSHAAMMNPGLNDVQGKR